MHDEDLPSVEHLSLLVAILFGSERTTKKAVRRAWEIFATARREINEQRRISVAFKPRPEVLDSSPTISIHEALEYHRSLANPRYKTKGPLQRALFRHRLTVLRLKLGGQVITRETWASLTPRDK